MNPPPLLLSCTLLFWGWQSHLLWFAVPMALILEIARFVGWRLALSDKDFNRVTDLTSLSFILVAFYLVNQESVYGLIILLNWLPMQFFFTDSRPNL
ncbi:membrane protein [Beggiatoa sp. PS]|nr:membrane protein [Beggiatoa sp. PS]